MFTRTCFIGIGLIGASMALAMRQHGITQEIVASSRTNETCEEAIRLGIVDAASPDMAAMTAGADLIVLAAPVGATAHILKTIAPALKQGAIVTDVGSVKQAVIDAALPYLPTGVHFVPAHPIAGTEHSGPAAGFATLFEKRWCILTPLENTSEEVIQKIETLWQTIGAKTARMTAAHHDLVLAVTSHIPHLIAYTIVGTCTDLEGSLQQEVIQYSASGFRDFTRIAASDPTMWRDIFLSNKPAVLEMLGRFRADLNRLEHAIAAEDRQTLFDHFTRTRAVRRGIVAEGQA